MHHHIAVVTDPQVHISHMHFSSTGCGAFVVVSFLVVVFFLDLLSLVAAAAAVVFPLDAVAAEVAFVVVDTFLSFVMLLLLSLEHSNQ